MSYRENKQKAIYINDEPTMTDQSQGHETDINVIVGKYGINGTAAGATGQPMYADWTEFPNDLRDWIETGRRIDSIRDQLPEPLREMPIEQILALQPDELTNILKPPVAPAPPDGPPAAAPPNQGDK